MLQDKKVYYDLAYIVSCALNGKQPNLKGIDLPKVKIEAQNDSILPLLGAVVPQFREAYYVNLYRNSNFEKYRKQLYEFFDNNDVLHCSLKGIVVKEFYPHSAMRFMSDYDVLFDAQKKNEVRKWLENNNVKIMFYREMHEGEKEDSVLFNNQFHFELHHCLLNEGYVAEPWYKYFSNEELHKRLVHVLGSEYCMTAEDLYLFFLVHAYKHSAYVCDMRTLIDCYLINKNLLYDKKYVEKKLAEFGLLDYEYNIRVVGKKVIDGEQLSPKEENYFLQCAGNKTFGEPYLNELRRIAGSGEITQDIRNKAILNLFILPSDKMRKIYPFIYYSLILRPVYHIARSLKRIINWKDTKEMIDKYRSVG